MTTAEMHRHTLASKNLTLILASSGPGHAIGRANGLPWPRLKYEMAYFSRVTQQQSTASLPPNHLPNTVIMGRKTWTSLPAKVRPLPNRRNIVVSTQGQAAVLAEHPPSPNSVPDSVKVVSSLHAAFEQASLGDHAKTFVIGGATLYQEALPYATHVLLTRIYRSFPDCDTYMSPELDLPVDEDQSSDKWTCESFATLKNFVGDEIFKSIPVDEKGFVQEDGLYYQFRLYTNKQGA